MLMPNWSIFAICGLHWLLLSGSLHAESDALAQSKDVALLVVGGSLARPLNLTGADLKKLPRQTARSTDKNGQEIVFQGVLIRDVLKEAGIKFGDKQSRGDLLLSYLVIEAADGYKVLFALSDFEADLTDKLLLLADTADDKPIDVKDGPLRLIIPDEKKHARWVRQVVSLKVVRTPDRQKPSDNDKKH